MTTKDIQVNKFAVRFEGVRFGPGLPAGNVVFDVPADSADKLIAESNGTIVELPRREDIKVKSSVGNGKQKGKKPDNDQMVDQGSEAGVLPAIDPGSTVK